MYFAVGFFLHKKRAETVKVSVSARQAFACKKEGDGLVYSM